MIIITGILDYRVPEEQAFQLFTLLQRLGIDRKLLLIPDKYNFVVKPQDTRFWWDSIFDWVKKYR